MRKFIAIAITMLLVTCTVTQVEAQKQYKFGSKVAPVTVASALAVSVTPYASFSQYELSADTNITVNVVTTKSLPGDLLTFKVKANTANRTITWGTAIQSTASTVNTGKTATYLFIWNGTNYYICGSGAAD